MAEINEGRWGGGLRHSRWEQRDTEDPGLTLCLETRSGANRFLCDKPVLDMFKLEESSHNSSCLPLIKN